MKYLLVLFILCGCTQTVELENRVSIRQIYEIEIPHAYCYTTSALEYNSISCVTKGK